MSRIRLLTKAKLREAVNLANEVFPGEEEESPSEELPASLNPERYDGYLLKTKKSNIKYWLVIDDLGQVAGIIGLYCYGRDRDEAFWLGWFCVRPDLRRGGIGNRLLRFAIKKAKKAGKKFLRLDTSTEPSEFAARRLYEKYGFKLTAREPSLDKNIEKLYYELRL